MKKITIYFLLACCYTPDHAQAKCMWDKPRALTSWKGSPGHNNVILNNEKWEEMDSRALIE